MKRVWSVLDCAVDAQRKSAALHHAIEVLHEMDASPPVITFMQARARDAHIVTRWVTDYCEGMLA